jgi:hypothetical protein
MRDTIKAGARHRLVAIAAVFVLAGAAPAFAHPHHDGHWHHGHWHHHWHRHWGYDGGYYGPPPVVYSRPYYAPPPVVYTPGFGVNIHIP